MGKGQATALCLANASYFALHFYNGYICEEPEQTFLDCFSMTGPICPTEKEALLDASWSLIYGVMGQTVAVVLSKTVEKMFLLVKYLFAPRPRPECPHCRSRDCLACHECDWWPSKPCSPSLDNMEMRIAAMKCFRSGLRCRIFRGKAMEDAFFKQRHAIKQFHAEHIRLFPKCIQNKINQWFPLI